MMGDLLLGAPTMGTHGAIGAFVDDVSAVTFIDAFDASRDNGSRIQLVTNRADVNSCYIQLLKRVDGEFILLGELALATPPQEFDLPLAEGWSGTAKYFKTQEEICVVFLDIVKNAAISNWEVLATLPEAFRPSYNKNVSASVYAPSSSTTIGVALDGTISVGSMEYNTQARNIYATLIFIAAS